jgi:hypothetical protein
MYEQLELKVARSLAATARAALARAATARAAGAARSSKLPELYELWPSPSPPPKLGNTPTGANLLALSLCTESLTTRSL